LKILGRGCLGRPSAGLVHALELGPQKVGRNEVFWFSLPLLAARDGQRLTGRLLGRVGYALDYRQREGFCGVAIAVSDDTLTRIGFNWPLAEVEALHRAYLDAAIDKKSGVLDVDAGATTVNTISIVEDASLQHMQVEALRIRLPKRWDTYLSREQLFGMIRSHGDFSQAETRGYLLRESDNAPCDVELTTDFLAVWNEQTTGRNIWQEQRDAALAAQAKAENDLNAVAEHYQAARRAIAELERVKVKAEADLQSAKATASETKQQLAQRADEAARASKELDAARTAIQAHANRETELKRQLELSADSASRYAQLAAEHQTALDEQQRMLRELKKGEIAAAERDTAVQRERKARVELDHALQAQKTYKRDRETYIKQLNVAHQTEVRELVAKIADAGAGQGSMIDNPRWLGQQELPQPKSRSSGAAMFLSMALLAVSAAPVGFYFREFVEPKLPLQVTELRKQIATLTKYLKDEKTASGEHQREISSLKQELNNPKIANSAFNSALKTMAEQHQGELSRLNDSHATDASILKTEIASLKTQLHQRKQEPPPGTPPVETPKEPNSSPELTRGNASIQPPGPEPAPTTQLTARNTESNTATIECSFGDADVKYFENLQSQCASRKKEAKNIEACTNIVQFNSIKAKVESCKKNNEPKIQKCTKAYESSAKAFPKNYINEEQEATLNIMLTTIKCLRAP